MSDRVKRPANSDGAAGNRSTGFFQIKHSGYPLESELARELDIPELYARYLLDLLTS